MHKNAKNNVSGTAMCRVTAKTLLNKDLQIRREHAGSLLQAARLVQSMELTIRMILVRVAVWEMRHSKGSSVHIW